MVSVKNIVDKNRKGYYNMDEFERNEPDIAKGGMAGFDSDKKI